MSIDAAGAPLNPNELAAVMRVLHMLARISTSSGDAAQGDADDGSGDDSRKPVVAVSSRQLLFDLHVPNTIGVLVRACDAFFNDSPWVAGRLIASTTSGVSGRLGGIVGTHVVHASMSAELCAALGVLRLSEVVTERVSRGSPPTPSVEPSAAVFSRQATTVLHTPAVASALSRIVIHAVVSRRGVLVCGAHRTRSSSCLCRGVLLCGAHYSLYFCACAAAFAGSQ